MPPLFRKILGLAFALGFAWGGGATLARAEPGEAPSFVGQRLVLAAEVGSGVGPFRYQWYKNGAPLSGATNEQLVFSSLRLSDEGLYAVVVSNADGSAASLPEMLQVVETAPSRLTNVSIVATAAELVAGFSLGGSDTSGVSRLLVRASGPALAQFGVGPVMADPILTLSEQDRVIAVNDDWSGAELLSVSAARAGAFPFPPASKDAALVASLPASVYTALVTDRTGGSGAVMMELYEVLTGTEQPPAPRLVNLSARGAVGAGSSRLTLGFAVDGVAPIRVLLRGVGPGLAGFGVSSVLRDPRLTLFRQSTLIGSNERWGEGDAAEIVAAAGAANAFALTDQSSDAALLVSLQPGVYSVQLSSVQEQSGVALIELYVVP